MKAKSMKARVLNVQGASARMAAMGHEGAFPRQGRASAIGSVNGHSWDVGQRTDAPLAILSGHVPALFLVSAVTRVLARPIA